MVFLHGGGLIQPATSLQNFFHQRIESAIDKHCIDGDDDALWYLTQLLCTFSRSSNFLEDNGFRSALTPLAEYYRLALESSTQHERRLQLQRLGDIAIFIAGLFAGALQRKVVGVDYYIAMGESAYGTLANESAQSPRDKALRDIFGSLAEGFSDYVVALSEVPTRENDEHTLLQLIDEWEQHRHPAVARKLRRKGVFLDNDDHRLH